MDYGIGFTRVTKDTLIVNKAAYLFGYHLEASVDGGDATFYEGLDTDTGRKILTAKGLANNNPPVMFQTPVFCARGIYLDVGSNMTAVTVFWLPDPPDYLMSAVNTLQKIIGGG